MTFDRFEKNSEWIAIFRMDYYRVETDDGSFLMFSKGATPSEQGYNARSLEEFIRNTGNTELDAILVELKRRNVNCIDPTPFPRGKL